MRDLRVPVTRIAGFSLGIGAVAAVVGLTNLSGPTWSALLINFLFWTGLAQAGVIVAAVFHLTHARWGRTVQQIALGMGAFLPFSLLIFLLLWGMGYRVWGLASAPYPPDPRPYTPQYVRNGLALLVMVGLSFAYLNHSLREPPDDALVRSLSIAVVIGYFLVYSMFAVDLSLALSPAFTSTISPLIYLIGQFYAALGATAVLVAFWRRWELVARIIGRHELLDLGNLLWGAGITWAYLLWAQYFTIWMGNLPEEVAHHLARWQAPGVRLLAWAMVGCGFVVPFLMLFSRAVKRNERALGAAGLLGAAGVLMERHLDVIPGLAWPATAATILLSAAITLGFAALFLLCYLWLMRRVPLFPVSDPLLAEQLATRHVEV